MRAFFIGRILGLVSSGFQTYKQNFLIIAQDASDNCIGQFVKAIKQQQIHLTSLLLHTQKELSYSTLSPILTINTLV